MWLALLLCLGLPSSGGLRLPVNFWLLSRSGEAPPPHDVQLCNRCCQNIDDGDAAALAANLAALESCAVAVELGPEEGGAPPPPPRVVELRPGELAEQLCARGPRAFQLPRRGHPLEIGEAPFDEGGLGHSVWDASIGLAVWLTRHAEAVRGARVLELGSGVGLGGVAAAAAGAARVTLSEVTLSEMTRSEGTRSEMTRSEGTRSEGTVTKEARSEGPLGEGGADFGGERLLRELEANVRRNGLEAVARVVELNWEDCLSPEYEPECTYPVVIGSDLVHDEVYSLRSLAAAVSAFTEVGGTAYLMSTRGRPGVERLPLALSSLGEVEEEEMTLFNSYGKAELVLTTLRRRA
ncbi:hypothetical protein AB1Y20_010705 [Prymnesium parvum]|uniref:Calmodulin-lysine N-methyltransferase n=1 Tax=Prymnesium parvum TaxID=97485 RepID=A0AB34ISL9_PRYPA